MTASDFIQIWFLEEGMRVVLQDIVLDFSPGPILAVDGDRGLSSPVSYAILSGTTHTHARSDVQCVVFGYE